MEGLIDTRRRKLLFLLWAALVGIQGDGWIDGWREYIFI